MGKKRRRRADPPPQPTFSNSALAAGLAGLAGTLPAGEATADPPPQPAPPADDPSDLSRCGKLTLRIERAGRRGKTVTVLSGLDAERAQALLPRLRRAMGCGGSVEAGRKPSELRVVLQGDVRARARAWLERHGARRVVDG